MDFPVRNAIIIRWVITENKRQQFVAKPVYLLGFWDCVLSSPQHIENLQSGKVKIHVQSIRYF